MLIAPIAATPAFGHSKLVSSDPRDGSAVPSPVASVSLVFTDQLQSAAAKVVVLGPKHAAVRVTRLRVNGTQLTAAVSGASITGRYQLSYHVVSTDGHPITGTLAFRVLPAAQAAAAASAPGAAHQSPGSGSPLPLPVATSLPPSAPASPAEPSQRQSVVSALLLMALVPVLVAVGARRISRSTRAR